MGLAAGRGLSGHTKLYSPEAWRDSAIWPVNWVPTSAHCVAR